MREDNELVDGRILDGAFQTEQALSRSSSPTSISVRSSSKNPLLQGLASSEIEFDIFGGSSSDIGSVSNRTRATIETKSIGSSIISINTIKVGNATKLGSLPQLLPTSETTSFKKSSLTSLKPLHASKHGIADYSSHEELPEGSVMRTVEDRGTTSIALQKEEVFRDSPNANTSALDSWKSKEHTQEFESMISVREVRDEIQTELSSSNPSVKMGARSTSENGLKNQQTISRTSSFSPRQSLHLDEEVNQDTYQNQLDQLRLSVEGERPRSTSLSKDLDDGSAQSELSNSPTSVHAVESTGKLGTSEHDDDGRRFPTTLRNEKQLYVKESNSNVTTGAEIEVDSSAEFSQSSFSCEDGEELSESTSESAGFSDHGTILEGIPSHVDLRAVGSSTSVMGSAVPSNADLLDSGRSMNPTMVENRYSKHELLDSTKPKSTSNIRETVGDDGNLQHKSPIHASQPFLQPAEAQDNTKKEYSGESAQLEQESNPGASVVRVSQAHEKSHEWLGLSSEPEFTSSETVATAVSPHDQPSNSSAVKPVESYQASPASSDAAPVANHHILPVAASAIPTSVVKHVEKDVNSDPNVVSQNATESGNESGTESETSSEYGSDEESEGSTISNVVGKSTDDFWADSASVASGGTASADELSEAW
ncbi:hypothetical protein BC830DRAFT_371879 [Chytriomyces sp. MP71]|nr:hypothetical protein BC830DRAFT_371879 [Chytriomyces sp. MP71]